MFYLLLCLSFVSVHPASENHGPLWTWMSDNYGCNNYEAQERLFGYLYYQLRSLNVTTRKTLMSMIYAGFNGNTANVGDDLMAANYVCDTGNNYHEMRNVGPETPELEASYDFDATRKDLRGNPPFVETSAENSPTIRKSAMPIFNERFGGRDDGVYEDDEFLIDDDIIEPTASFRKSALNGGNGALRKSALNGGNGALRKSSLSTDYGGNNDDEVIAGNNNEMRNVRPTFRKSSLNMDNAGNCGDNIEKMDNDRINNDYVTERNKWRPVGNNHNEMRNVRPMPIRKTSLPTLNNRSGGNNNGVYEDEEFKEDDAIEMNKRRPAGKSHYKMRNVEPTEPLRRSSMNMDNAGHGDNNIKHNDDVIEGNKWRPSRNNHNKKNVKPTETFRKSSMNMDYAEYGGKNVEKMDNDDVIETNKWRPADDNHSKMRNVEPTETFRKSSMNTDQAEYGGNNIEKMDNDRVNNDDVIDTTNCPPADNNHNEMRNVGPTKRFRKAALVDMLGLTHDEDDPHDNEDHHQNDDPHHDDDNEKLFFGLF